MVLYFVCSSKVVGGYYCSLLIVIAHIFSPTFNNSNIFPFKLDSGMINLWDVTVCVNWMSGKIKESNKIFERPNYSSVL
jgi:hypothetical protein